MSARAVRVFRVRFEHDDGGWHVFIPAVKGCRSWGRTIEAAREHIREALATCVDVFPDAETIAQTAVFEDDIQLPSNIRQIARRALLLRSKLEEMRVKTAERNEAAARSLTSEFGLSLRDAGEILKLSQESVRSLVRKKAVVRRTIAKPAPRAPKRAAARVRADVD